MRLELHPDALRELREAAVWYETQRAGLGSAFVASVGATVERALDDPLVFPKHPADVRVRRALVARFPYAVVFALLGDTVYVVAFAHGRRRSGYWKTRVQGRR